MCAASIIYISPQIYKLIHAVLLKDYINIVTLSARSMIYLQAGSDPFLSLLLSLPPSTHLIGDKRKVNHRD